MKNRKAVPLEWSVADYVGYLLKYWIIKRKDFSFGFFCFNFKALFIFGTKNLFHIKIIARRIPGDQDKDALNGNLWNRKSVKLEKSWTIRGPYIGCIKNSAQAPHDFDRNHFMAVKKWIKKIDSFSLNRGSKLKILL